MQISRTLLIINLLFAFHAAQAGHEKGAFIFTYESVAGVNNNPLEYVITGYAVGDAMGIPLPNTKSLNITSSCFPSATATLQKVAVLSVDPISDYCTPGTSISTYNNLSIYRDTITLPGTCSDFLFSVSGSSGLYFNTSNIDDNYNNAYFYATLDNTNGPNSSPTAEVSDIIQAACINQPLNLYGFTETDGDSVHYSKSAPSKISGSTVSDFGYKPGYSLSNPVASSQGYVLNSSTGSVQTELSAVGEYIVTTKYEEYRYDSTQAGYVQIGEGKFIMNLLGASNCNSASFNLEYPIAPDPDSVQCGETTITIRTSRKLAPATITSSGSEFSVLTASGSIPVSGAQAIADSLIEIQLAQPISGNTTLSVVVQTGSDGDVVLSYCGKELIAFDDTLDFYSSGAAVSAAFSYNTNYLSADFNSASSIADSVIWDFGDGSPVDNSFNPMHLYGNAGQYTVELVAFNQCGETDTAFQIIEVCDTLQPLFSSSFVDDSLLFDAGVTSGALTFYWDFGDGNNDSGSTVKHSYTASGTYIVSLTVTNACGDTASVQDTVESCAAPVPDWTYEVVSTGGSGMTVEFDGTASQNVDSFLWDFDDGNTNNTSLTPTHTYVTPSLSYRVTLTVFNACGQSSTYGYRLSEIGVEEIGIDLNLKIYPNPVDDQVTIESEDDLVNISLFAVDGKKLLECFYPEKQNSVVLSLKHLNAGMYLLKVKTVNGRAEVVKLRLD